MHGTGRRRQKRFGLSKRVTAVVDLTELSQDPDEAEPVITKEVLNTTLVPVVPSGPVDPAGPAASPVPAPSVLGKSVLGVRKRPVTESPSALVPAYCPDIVASVLSQSDVKEKPVVIEDEPLVKGVDAMWADLSLRTSIKISSTKFPRIQITDQSRWGQDMQKALVNYVFRPTNDRKESQWPPAQEESQIAIWHRAFVGLLAGVFSGSQFTAILLPPPSGLTVLIYPVPEAATFIGVVSKSTASLRHQLRRGMASYKIQSSGSDGALIFKGRFQVQCLLDVLRNIFLTSVDGVPVMISNSPFPGGTMTAATWKIERLEQGPKTAPDEIYHVILDGIFLPVQTKWLIMALSNQQARFNVQFTTPPQSFGLNVFNALKGRVVDVFSSRDEMQAIYSTGVDLNLCR